MAERPAGDVRVIRTRALNRATLARQLLLERTGRTVMDVLGHLVGLQGQAPNPPYIGLWSRIGGFEPPQLATLLESREAVRSTLHRATLHVLRADDFIALRAAAQPIFERGLRASWGRWLVGVDIGEVEAFSRAFFDGEPRGAFELRHALAERWPGFDPLALTAVGRYLLPLVHAPPAGSWDANRPAMLTPAQAWLGRELAPPATPDALFLRYLAAFGPATAQDFGKWSGLTGLAAMVTRLRPQLRVLHYRESGGRGAPSEHDERNSSEQDERVDLSERDERIDLADSTELFDLPDAPLPDETVAAPVRLLPEWDNILLAYTAKTRQRILPEAWRARVFTNNGLIRATVLVDGFVAGIWKLERTAEEATVAIELFEPVPAATQAEIEAEARSLLATFGGGRAPAVEFRPT